MTTTIDQSNKASSQVNTFFHKKIADLVYHEGPLLSLFCDDEKNAFLYKWVDCNDESNSWIIFHVTNQQLSDFFNREKSLSDLCLEASKYITIDIADDLTIDTSFIRLLDNIPMQYRPDKDSYFDKIIYTEFADTLRILFSCNVMLFNNESINLEKYVKSHYPESKIIDIAIADDVD